VFRRRNLVQLVIQFDLNRHSLEQHFDHEHELERHFGNEHRSEHRHQHDDHDDDDDHEQLELYGQHDGKSEHGQQLDRLDGNPHGNDCDGLEHFDGFNGFEQHVRLERLERLVWLDGQRQSHHRDGTRRLGVWHL
jgi:hypothetical protein